MFRAFEIRGFRCFDHLRLEGLQRVNLIAGKNNTGKTALLATWMRRDRTSSARPFAGIFFWSFYRNLDARAFLQALVEFGRAELRWSTSADDPRTLVEQAAAYSGAADEARTADRIAEQESLLAELEREKAQLEK